MIQKKRTVVKRKTKPAAKSPKRKSIKAPKATLSSIQGTLNQVVEKLGQHDNQFDQINRQFDQINEKLVLHDQQFAKMDQRFEKIEDKLVKMDKEVAKISLDHENKILPALKESAEENERLHQKIDDLETRLNNKIDTAFQDLKTVFTDHKVRTETTLTNYENRISALESRPA